jgi:transcriptional regulator with XRE-family HTH domain
MYMAVINPVRDLVAVGAVRRACLNGDARHIRRLAGVSMEQMAAACGVSYATLLRWEHGRRSPRTRAALRLASVLAALVASLGDSEDEAVRRFSAAVDRRGAAMPD